MMMKKKIAGAGMAALLAASLGVVSGATASSAAPQTAAVAAAPLPSNTAIPVTGTLPDGTVVIGTISNLTASVVNGVLTLSGTLTSSAIPGGTSGFTAEILDIRASGSCDILTLDLGPLHLDVLGLVVDLAPVNLDITAVSGSGNLLGNLLCAVAGLFDSGAPLTEVTRLLDRLLSLLGL